MSKKEKTSYQDIIAELNKEYGKNTVVNLTDKVTGTYDVIPTGSIGIDYSVLGIGGFAKGKMYEVRGWKGANKTTICGHLVANAQKMDMKVLYIDSEHAVDLQYFKQLGVDPGNMLFTQPDYGEMGFDIAVKLINTGELDLVIIDSDSGLIPKVIMEGEIGQATIGKKAKLNNDCYPKLKVACEKNNTCVVVISQYRDKIGVMFGDPRTTQGGHTLSYYADTIIDLSASLKKEGDETSGTITTFKTLKNKTYVPFRNYKFPTIFGYGIDKLTEIIDLGADYQIYKKWGDKITLPDETKITVNEFMEKLKDEEFYNDLKHKIIQCLK